jgi:hypothetical protein
MSMIEANDQQVKLQAKSILAPLLYKPAARSNTPIDRYYGPE